MLGTVSPLPQIQKPGRLPFPTMYRTPNGASMHFSQNGFGGIENGELRMTQKMDRPKLIANSDVLNVHPVHPPISGSQFSILNSLLIYSSNQYCSKSLQTSFHSWYLDIRGYSYLHCQQGIRRKKRLQVFRHMEGVPGHQRICSWPLLP